MYMRLAITVLLGTLASIILIGLVSAVFVFEIVKEDMEDIYGS